MNDGLAGMVPAELKELTELQDLHLSGTALTGSLSLVFCVGDFNIPNFEADCAGRYKAEVQCSCCTVCCGTIENEPYSCGRNRIAIALSALLAEADLDRRALSSPGTLQYQALNWLSYDDPANLDFELVSSDDLLERFVMALLYFSTGGEDWADSSGFLSALSVCSWNEYSDSGSLNFGVLCDPMIVEIRFRSNNLIGQLPTELGLLTNLQSFSVRKFATISTWELDTIISLGSILQLIFSTVL
jgi:hypothetical protein